MKKWTSGFVSFVLALTGAGALAPVSFAVAETNQAQSLTNESQASVGYNELVKLISRTDTSLNNKGNYCLNSDIDCKEIAPEVFNNYGAEKFFTGMFDGNGHSIKNLTLSSNNGFYGLFPYAKNATIKNLKIEGWNFDFKNAPTNDIVAGLLVGYGENVRFENCEVVLKDENGVVQTILLGTYGENSEPQALNNHITFGLLAGLVDGNASLSSNEANIKNCLVSGNVKLNQTEDKIANIGGLVGKLKNGFISHCIFNGKVEYSGLGSLAKKVGGIVGEAQGLNAKVRNVCFDGSVSIDELPGLSSGNIIGGKNAGDFPENENFDYCYWTSLNGGGLGGESYTKLTFINTSVISKDFLLTENNFDDVLPEWNFDTIWSGKNGVLHLQNFMTFGLELNTQADVGGVFTARIDGETGKTVHKRYDEEVKFVLTTDSTKKDWYTFDGVLLNGVALSNSLYSSQQNENSYTVTVNANSLTEGTYSFRAKELKYSGLIETVVQDDESATDYGGVKIKGAISTSTSLSLDFSYASQTKNIEAVGKGKYIFAGWELYYKNDEDVWEKQTEAVSANNSKDISVTYTPSDSTKLYNRPFKIVALFSKNVKVVNFANYDKTQVKFLKVNGEEFNGTGIEVAASSTNVSIEIVTKNATMNADKFVQDFNKLHTSNPLSLRDDPVVNEEEQEAIYTFTLDISKIDNAELDENNTLHLSITTQKARMGASKNMIWLYILLPVFAVACMTAIIVILVKKKRGGRGKHKTVKKNNDTKKVSYKDYYI